MELAQLELQKETEVDPFIIFEYSIRSPYTKESYFRRLRRFFDAISLEGPTFEGRFNMFVQNGQIESVYRATSDPRTTEPELLLPKLVRL